MNHSKLDTIPWHFCRLGDCLHVVLGAERLFLLCWLWGFGVILLSGAPLFYSGLFIILLRLLGSWHFSSLLAIAVNWTHSFMFWWRKILNSMVFPGCVVATRSKCFLVLGLSSIYHTCSMFQRNSRYGFYFDLSLGFGVLSSHDLLILRAAAISN